MRLGAAPGAGPGPVRELVWRQRRDKALDRALSPGAGQAGGPGGAAGVGPGGRPGGFGGGGGFGNFAPNPDAGSWIHEAGTISSSMTERKMASLRSPR